jgi:putative oxidoreductase
MEMILQNCNGALSTLPIALRVRRHQFHCIENSKCGSLPMTDTRLAPYGAFLLRVALGVMFIAHAYLKIAVFTLPGFAGFLAQTGLPTFLAWPIVLAELLGGAALILGVQTRLVSLALLPILLGALVIHAPNGWLFTAANGGWEYPAFLAIASVVQALIGGGAFALTGASTANVDSGARQYAS